MHDMRVFSLFTSEARTTRLLDQYLHDLSGIQFAGLVTGYALTSGDFAVAHLSGIAAKSMEASCPIGNDVIPIV
jgi:hypothetical protein